MILQHGKDVLVKMLKNKMYIIMFCVVKDSKLILKGPSINDVTHLGGDLLKAYLVFLGDKGQGGVKNPLYVQIIYKC